MKIKVEKYNPNWSNDFEGIKTELTELLGFIGPSIEHIGSTSVQGLSAKPIIDILVGVNNEVDLNNTIVPLTERNYVYYEMYNKVMPYRRFFVKHKVDPKEFSVPLIITDEDCFPSITNEYTHRLAHIHVLAFNSEHWIRHVAFRDYLRTHLDVKTQYQNLKEILCEEEWLDGSKYNDAKDDFLKLEEAKAVQWYQNK